jgi:hypothetical protein
VTSPIFKYIDFVVYSLVLKVLNKSVVCREPMPLLPFERGIQVIYIVRLKRSSRYLAKVCDCLAWLDSYIYIRVLSFKVLYNIKLTCIVERSGLVYLYLCQFPVYWMRAN